MIRAPTTGEAIALSAALASLASGEWEDEVAVWDVLGIWWPPKLIRAVRRWPLRHLAALLKHQLTAGIPDPRRPPEGPPRPWPDVLALYARAYGAAPAEALATPWPVFAALVRGADRALAWQTIHAAEATALPYAGKDGLARLWSRAGFGGGAGARTMSKKDRLAAWDRV